VNDVAATSGHVGEYLVVPTAWSMPRTRSRTDGARRIAFLEALELDAVDLLGFSIGSFVAQEN